MRDCCGGDLDLRLDLNYRMWTSDGMGQRNPLGSHQFL